VVRSLPIIRWFEPTTPFGTVKEFVNLQIVHVVEGFRPRSGAPNCYIYARLNAG